MCGLRTYTHKHTYTLDSVLICAKMVTMCLIFDVLPNIYLLKSNGIDEWMSSYKWACTMHIRCHRYRTSSRESTLLNKLRELNIFLPFHWFYVHSSSSCWGCCCCSFKFWCLSFVWCSAHIFSVVIKSHWCGQFIHFSFNLVNSHNLVKILPFFASSNNQFDEISCHENFQAGTMKYVIKAKMKA